MELPSRKDVSLPHQLQRAMAAEAEASREARAKVIAAEGEMKASRALKEASDVINESPAALQVPQHHSFYSRMADVFVPATLPADPQQHLRREELHYNFSIAFGFYNAFSVRRTTKPLSLTLNVFTIVILINVCLLYSHVACFSLSSFDVRPYGRMVNYIM